MYRKLFASFLSLVALNACLLVYVVTNPFPQWTKLMLGLTNLTSWSIFGWYIQVTRRTGRDPNVSIDSGIGLDHNEWLGEPNGEHVQPDHPV